MSCVLLLKDISANKGVKYLWVVLFFSSLQLRMFFFGAVLGGQRQELLCQAMGERLLQHPGVAERRFEKDGKI